jgi:hypothetical protein
MSGAAFYWTRSPKSEQERRTETFGLGIFPDTR